MDYLCTCGDKRKRTLRTTKQAQIRWNIWFFCSTTVLLLLAKHGTCQEDGLSQTFYTREEQPTGTLIGLIGEGMEGVPAPFLLYGEMADVQLAVDIKNDGAIYVKEPFDHEKRQRYQFVAISQTSGKTIHITIIVQDINDHQPEFKVKEKTIDIVESAPGDVKYALGSAVDKDQGNFSTQRFEIEHGNIGGAFRLGYKRAQNGLLYLDLEINAPLDYEITPKYTLIIRAYDGGSPPKFGTLTVKINILDANDNQPIFNSSHYFAMVAENASVGASVLQVYATDRDSGENGDIRYHIDRQRSDPARHFDMNSLTGSLFVNGELDYETKKTYELIVVARDNGTQRLETSAIVSVQVTNVNDNPPAINLLFVSGDTTGSIPESFQTGELVARISVSDPDVDKPGADPGVSVSLSGGDGHFNLTSRDRIVYMMMLTKALDRELRESYTITVVAKDSGSPPHQAKKTFTINISDENDNPPVFTQEIYYSDIQEVVPPGSSVIHVTALDKDAGKNAQVTYEILNNPRDHSDWFQVDNHTGLITTKSRVDCETASKPRLLVVARDGGQRPLSSTTTVMINIRDVNDNQPVFDHSFYNVSVSEAVSVGKCVLTVSASDPDCGKNTRVEYTVASNMGFLYPAEFEVRKLTGEICVVKPLDFESKQVYDFAVIAKDQDALDTTAMVKIVVKDTNDNRPVFYPAEYSVNLNADTQVGTEVVVVKATDQDTGTYGTVKYHIVGEGSQQTFYINSTSGVIKLQTALPSSPQIHNLEIIAEDGGGLRSEVNAKVNISVPDNANDPPEFALSLYKFSVPEDAVKDTVVGIVQASTKKGSSVVYTLMAGDPNGYLDIDPHTGQLKTLKPLNHDTNPWLLLNIQARSGDPPVFGNAQVNVSIGDVNDNAPQFAVSSIEVVVREDAAIDSTVYMVQAHDPDSGDNGTVRYSLEDATNTFIINRRTGQIQVKRHLDYESNTRLELVVTAYDLGKPRKESSMTLVVGVRDVNDNAPKFVQAKYNFSVSEGVEVNSNIGQVKARDLDSGNNGKVTYSVRNELGEKKFGIFPDTGYLYNLVQLDREEKEKYTLKVVAIDNGVPAKSATADVTILIEDANDNSPDFGEISSYEFDIEENRPPYSRVGIVTATDKDHTDRVVYSIVGDNSIFYIDSESGEIVTKNVLDRESQMKYSFTVQANDTGKPSRSAKVKVNVNVTDVNDNSPIFGHLGRYSVSVNENKPNGTSVLTVTATDRDQGVNGQITYSFHTDDENLDYQAFRINPRSGEIKTATILDHESRSQYSFKVVATDGGSAPRRTYKSVQIDVLDENESPPKFSDTHVTFTVKENTAPGATVGRVTASDPDSGENGRIDYYIIWGNLFSTFGLNGTTGAIYISKPVDYEECSSYSILVMATDNSVINPKFSVINVSIAIVDLNDNAPVFRDNPVVITMRENIPKGNHIYTFSATDLDSWPRGQVHYSIERQSPPGEWFRIEPITGKLRNNKLIDYEKTTQISLVVKATDQAPSEKERLFSTVTANVFIEDVNDNKPEFQGRSQVMIMEDEPVGYPVMNVVAVDHDSAENGRVTYEIVSGNEEFHFHLDETTGMLTITRMLDRERDDQFYLNISASDHGQTRLTSFTLVTVHVMDVNDNAPVFNHSVYTANVSENMPLETYVTHIMATDADIGANAKLQYLIPYGIGNNRFSIDRDTGEITTSVILDREEQSNWVITAYVKDSVFPALYDTTTVLVTVLDENDNYPQFRDSVYYLEVPENSRLAVIHTVMAMDADAGDNGLVTYRILAGNPDKKFTLDPVSGKLSCAPLDRETFALYNLTVEARDGGDPSLSNLSSIVIRVLDDNDNDPIFKQNRYSKTIAENTEVGTSVLTVEATDADEGNNSAIFYSITNGAEGQFRIDNSTGVIWTTGEFDREKKDEYSFDIHAQDGGLYGPRSKTANVVIKISDVNDNAPVFSQIPYKASIAANHAVRSYVTKVSATDRDKGHNGKVIYSFKNLSQYFQIDPHDGTIITQKLLDPVAITMHRLYVIARDDANVPKWTTGVVEITVGNAGGGGSIRFTNITYNTNISENSPKGTPVVTVKASFVSGESDDIAYSFANGNEDNTFDIDDQTGEIVVKDPSGLDYENAQRLRLIVVATSKTAYGYTTVWVNLNDVNDNKPRFSQERYISAVYEGSTSRHTYVTQVMATDVDQGDNGKVTYEIISGNINDAFVISPPHTGIVKTNIILDREIRDLYKLEIKAVDEGRPVLSSTCTLRIQIVDINDNAPFFPTYQPVNIKEGTELGTIVLHVTANDADLNPKLTYDFAEGGNPLEAFSIDRYSGKIAVAKPLDFEFRSKYVLIVTASDNEHIASTEVVINIVDENDNPPVFREQSYEVTLPENTGPHYSVITVNATDRDAGDNARINYSMVQVHGFYINQQTGTIYTNQTVNFNPSQPTIHLVVTAQDSGSPVLPAVVAIRVQVIDINNNYPIFTNSSYSGEISENEEYGQIVVTVTAHDADDMYDNRKIDYQITDGNSKNVFSITTSTFGETYIGKIVLQGKLDREDTSHYVLTVRASDRGEPPLSSTALIHIQVRDVNDNTPVFSKKAYSSEIRENATVGTSVLQVSASDLDTGVNSQIRYMFISGNDDECFFVNPNSGVVTVLNALDHETRDEHRLIVQAIDSSRNDPQKSAYATIVINVTDVNEFPPVFPIIMYVESLNEHEDIGSAVFTANANDDDGGLYGLVEYSIIDEEEQPFSIDPHSGVVTTKMKFDFEKQNAYGFVLKAEDRGGLSATVTVIVNIQPKNEFRPQFTKRAYSLEVKGDAKQGDEIGRVEALGKHNEVLQSVIYSFREEHEYFGINRTSGMIYVAKDLQWNSDGKSDNQVQNRKKRFISTMDGRRFRRALEDDLVKLHVTASSGSPNPRMAEAVVEIDVDRTCPGCAVGSLGQEGNDAMVLSPTLLVLVLVIIFILVVLVIVLVVVYMVRRKKRRRLHEQPYDSSSFETVDVPPPIHPLSHGYKEGQKYPHHLHNHNHMVTTSEVSDQSHSASSGRGSVEEHEDVDDEIRMINSTPVHADGVRIPDSGIQQDDDAVSEQSVQNHQEYLKRLGIDTTKLKVNKTGGPAITSSVESMHQFSDEGGGEGDGLDIGNIMYAKLGEMEADENLAVMDGTRDYGFGDAEPSNAGSLSSVINSEEEFSGSYNWDYLLDWGPQYQPLAHVFAEIARLKDDNIKPKTAPTHIVPQKPNNTSLHPQIRTVPPPMITDAPPRAIMLAQPVVTRQSQSNMSNSSTSNSLNSARTSQLTSVSLPKSPISYESSFTSPAMTPSFAQSLSPLATRSPSISPLVTPKGIGSGSSGQNTPSRTHHSSLNGDSRVIDFSESEHEIQI